MEGSILYTQRSGISIQGLQPCVQGMQGMRGVNRRQRCVQASPAKRGVCRVGRYTASHSTNPLWRSGYLGAGTDLAVVRYNSVWEHEFNFSFVNAWSARLLQFASPLCGSHHSIFTAIVPLIGGHSQDKHDECV